ncbi:uncharacterized protein LOC129798071 [Phlebotomus papatasi]|uniref:uncharacterized protein LOC129798071 n=1 Tax=Phlebotomus papatasi TaxID=29031 RepID=UPI002483C18F|nr:uncharacterized protein LOC129798071 [Phlebotomus papatasi]
MEKKLVLYQRAIEEERQYSEGISGTLRDLSSNVAEFVKIASQQREDQAVRDRITDEDLEKIAAFTKSIHAKVKSIALAVKEDKISREASKMTLAVGFEPHVLMNAQRELTEVKREMECSKKSFISMGCCLTELLSVLTQEDSNLDILTSNYESQIRVYFKFLEKTLISFFNTVHERENLPSSNYKFVCFATSVVGNIASKESGRKIIMSHEKNHFLLKTFLNLLCRLRYPREIQLLGIFLKFLCDMSLEDAAVKIIQNHLTVMEQIVDYINYGKIDLQYMATVLLFNTLDDLSRSQFERLLSKIDQIAWGSLLECSNDVLKTAGKKLFQQITKKRKSLSDK